LTGFTEELEAREMARLMDIKYDKLIVAEPVEKSNKVGHGGLENDFLAWVAAVDFKDEKDSKDADLVRPLALTKAKLLVVSELLDEVNPALHDEAVKHIKELDEASKGMKPAIREMSLSDLKGMMKGDRKSLMAAVGSFVILDMVLVSCQMTPIPINTETTTVPGQTATLTVEAPTAKTPALSTEVPVTLISPMIPTETMTIVPTATERPTATATTEPTSTVEAIKINEHDLGVKNVQEISTEYMGVKIDGNLITGMSLGSDIKKITLPESIYGEYIARLIFRIWWIKGNEQHNIMSTDDDLVKYMAMWATAQKSGDLSDWEKVQFKISANDLNDGNGYVYEKLTVWPMCDEETNTDGIKKIDKISIAAVNGMTTKSITNFKDNSFEEGYGTNIDDGYCFTFP
jgi:hypothetical protein